jgi:hypothetical protein
VVLVEEVVYVVELEDVDGKEVATPATSLYTIRRELPEVVLEVVLGSRCHRGIFHGTTSRTLVQCLNFHGQSQIPHACHAGEVTSNE